ncbi:translocation/assembly module TamB domain-containing protein [Candidatus Viadribacter manganicus]|uniref:translocation/assembly module TamB domain-containing protein n=1 Tax=Candidatus Viadribacter manganicus TaxID=1759059 RepID=UPI001D17227F|nr:translocation/assembly module TamB domain-containing protein [Candidatus Viadribacter manganicus]
MLGPAAHVVVDSLGDGARVWRLGTLKIDDVSGNWMGNLRAGTIMITDDDGLWLEAHDVALEWSPQDILFGTVRLNAARANSIAIARQPTLLAPRRATGAGFDVAIDQLHIERLTLAEPVVGHAAVFTTDLALNLRDETLQTIDLTLRRVDSEDDRLIALYHADRDYALSFDLYSAPGGIIARALRVEADGIRATAIGNGTLSAGDSHIEAATGARQLLIASTSWSETEWSASGQAHLDALPALQTLAERIGSRVDFNLTGTPRDRRFNAHTATPFLAIDVEGTLDADGELDGPARIVATTNQLSDVARESPFALGAARLEGELRRAHGVTAIRGILDAQQIDALGQRTELHGPVQAALSDEAFTLTADLRAPQRTAPLFVNARLQTALEYNRHRERFELNRTELASDAINLNAQGWVNGGDGEFAGEWRVRRMEALAPEMRGEATGRWRAFRDGEGDARAWAISVDGQGALFSGAPDVIPQLLGANPRLDARMRYENGGITVSHARIEGTQLRAGATGRIVNGIANLAVEASARGPLNLGGAEIGGAIDATGAVTGRITRPTLAMNGALSSFAAAGVVVEQPQINFTLAPNGSSYAGHAEVTGTASGQTLTAAANVAIADGTIGLTELDALWGGLQAQGNAQFASRGVSAVLDVNGAFDGLAPGLTGRLAGDLTLTPDAITLDANLADARAGDLRVRAATLHAQGPLDAIATTFDLRGRLRQASLAFAGNAVFNLDEQSARVEGRGTLADQPIFSRAPITVDWSAGRTQASVNVAIGDGVVHAQWEERGRALTGSAQIDDAPLAPLAAIWGERATGRIDGRIALNSNGGGLSGDADIRLDGARVSGRQRNTLDMHIVGTLTPTRLTGTVDATSEGGLVAHLQSDAPVETSAAPLRIALARERRGRASWSVRGPADALWAAARLPDQSLEGALDGEGSIEFGAGYLSGAGHLEIVDGRFEDKLTGVRLVDLDARVALDDRGVTIENFTASGPRGGRLTATGGSINDRQGTITVDVDNMRVADRPDARAVASGELTLAWEGLRSSLTGDLNIVEASIDIASNPQAGIPTLDVIEINRPGEEDEPLEEDQAPRRNGSTTLSVNVTAPGRVFTRGRGVDAEWSLNMRLGGTSARPLVFGTARAQRGTLALSGQPFEIEDAIIEFDGDPLDARINLTAVRDTADLSARVRLIGTARDPEITFSSEPALPEDEILPQVLFGRSVEDLSALEAAQLAASLAALSGRASLDLVDAARTAAGLDRFNVRQDESGGFLVAGGVYLTRDVYVEVARTGLGQAQTKVEWTVRPRLVLITSFLSNGDQRVSLRWRRETD